MIAAFALCLSTLAAAPTVDEFDIHALIAHPGLESGDFDQVREDWLRELEARPETRVAPPARSRPAAKASPAERTAEMHFRPDFKSGQRL